MIHFKGVTPPIVRIDYPDNYSESRRSGTVAEDTFGNCYQDFFRWPSENPQISLSTDHHDVLVLSIHRKADAPPHRCMITFESLPDYRNYLSSLLETAYERAPAILKESRHSGKDKIILQNKLDVMDLNYLRDQLFDLTFKQTLIPKSRVKSQRFLFANTWLPARKPVFPGPNNGIYKIDLPLEDAEKAHRAMLADGRIRRNQRQLVFDTEWVLEISRSKETGKIEFIIRPGISNDVHQFQTVLKG